MKCNDALDQFADVLAGEIDRKARKEFDDHLAQCPDCRAEFASLAETWTRLGVLPQERPSERMRSRFYAMLDDYQKRRFDESEAGPRRNKRFPGLGQLLARRPAFQAAAAAGLLLLGVFAGSRWGLFGRGGATEVAEVHQELQEMRQMLAVSLLKQESPFDRLQGVHLTRELRAADQGVLRSLYETLDNDPNVNVRRAAVDALYLFADQPGVKDHVLQSLTRQASPLVQAALIDLLVGIREQRAVAALRQIILVKGVNPVVKEKAVQGIERLTL